MTGHAPIYQSWAALEALACKNARGLQPAHLGSTQPVAPRLLILGVLEVGRLRGLHIDQPSGCPDTRDLRSKYIASNLLLPGFVTAHFCAQSDKAPGMPRDSVGVDIGER